MKTLCALGTAATLLVSCLAVRADLTKDSSVTFPATGALPSKHAPDRPAKDFHSPEEVYAIFATPERSLEQINKIQAEMVEGKFASPHRIGGT
jgi:hypothetical protein